MKLDRCERCQHHVDFLVDEVVCNFWDQETGRIVVRRSLEFYVKDCPKEKSARPSVIEALKS